MDENAARDREEIRGIRAERRGEKKERKTNVLTDKRQGFKVLITVVNT